MSRDERRPAAAFWARLSSFGFVWVCSTGGSEVVQRGGVQKAAGDGGRGLGGDAAGARTLKTLDEDTAGGVRNPVGTECASFCGEAVEGPIGVGDEVELAGGLNEQGVAGGLGGLAGGV